MWLGSKDFESWALLGSNAVRWCLVEVWTGIRQYVRVLRGFGLWCAMMIGARVRFLAFMIKRF